MGCFNITIQKTLIVLIKCVHSDSVSHLHEANCHPTPQALSSQVTSVHTEHISMQGTHTFPPIIPKRLPHVMILRFVMFIGALCFKPGLKQIAVLAHLDLGTCQMLNRLLILK